MSTALTIPGAYASEVVTYAAGVVDGTIIANEDRVLCCRRFLRMVEEGKYEIRTRDADLVVGLIETLFRHRKGERLDGTPLAGEPLILEPWQKFCIYGMLIFFIPGTRERLVKEALIFLPRKNGKTIFAAALAWALSIMERASGSVVYVVGAALRQAMETYNNWSYNLVPGMYPSIRAAKQDGWRVLNNSFEHCIAHPAFLGGSISLNALASNPDGQDSLGCNIVIADEIHAYKTPKQYNILKEATKAYTNKLVIGITTAGDDGTSFCAQKVDYARKILNDLIRDDALFLFICCADRDKETGEVDYTNPLTHQKANPNYGITIRPEDILRDSMEALNDPQQRKDFFAKSLNIFTASINSWFDIEEFRRSNTAARTALEMEQYWPLARKLKQLAQLPVKWYGGVDLSKWHDLTAAVLLGEYKGITIVIPHCWFPVVAAAKKADEDNIPLFGWKDDGWLDMVNKATNDPEAVVSWFVAMKKLGFKVAQVGYDRKFGEKFWRSMKKSGFKVVEQPQYFWRKSLGFRHIEVSAKNKNLYYLDAEPFEYCVQNVSAIEQTDDMIQYQKVQPNHRIDIFDAAVFAACRMLEAEGKAIDAEEWIGNGKT